MIAVTRILILFIVLAASFIFHSSELLDKNRQSSFHYWVTYCTSDLDWMVAIVFDNREEMYEV